MTTKTESPRQVTPVRRELPKVQTAIKAGPARRTENFGDPIGAYNLLDGQYVLPTGG